MKVKLYESKWDNRIKGELAKEFYAKIMASEIEGVKDASVKLLNKCKEFFDEDDEYIFNEVEALIKEFEEAEEEEELNGLLDELYDFCDGYSILIDVKEEPEDAEVFMDKDEEIPEIDIDPETDEIVEISDEDIEESCKTCK